MTVIYPVHKPATNGAQQRSNNKYKSKLKEIHAGTPNYATKATHTERKKNPKLCSATTKTGWKPIAEPKNERRGDPKRNPNSIIPIDPEASTTKEPKENLRKIAPLTRNQGGETNESEIGAWKLEKSEA